MLVVFVSTPLFVALCCAQAVLASVYDVPGVPGVCVYDITPSTDVDRL